ncbi:MAG: hypothetical protein N2376_14480 [Clostridia bacterium]|nr:hypothetical protein [Clostridia bacterium]
MNQLKKIMSRAKADEALKESTKAYLKDALLNQGRKQPAYTRIWKENVQMKKWLVAACALIVIVLTSGGAYAFYNTPVNYVSVDINPSIELGINAFNKVVSAEGVNEDGQTVLADQSVLNLNVQDAVNKIVQSAADKNFIAQDGSTVVAVTAESKNTDQATKLQNESAKGIDEAMSAKKAAAIVYKDCSDPALRAEAKALGLSPGKYKLIKMLQALDPSITVDQYKDAKVSDMVLKANELAQAAGISTKQFENVKDAAEKVKAMRDGDEEELDKADDSNATQITNEEDQDQQKLDEQKPDNQKQNNGKHNGQNKQKGNNGKKLDEQKNEDENNNDEQDHNQQTITQKQDESQLQNADDRHEEDSDKDDDGGANQGSQDDEHDD